MFLAATLAVPPAQPQMWIAHNATITTTGTLPGLDPGTVELTLSYDYEQKMEKHEFKTGQDAGKTVVFRWDKKDPGSRGAAHLNGRRARRPCAATSISARRALVR